MTTAVGLINMPQVCQQSTLYFRILYSLLSREMQRMMIHVRSIDKEECSLES